MSFFPDDMSHPFIPIYPGLSLVPPPTPPAHKGFDIFEMV